jgi:hypothetical protein
VPEDKIRAIHAAFVQAASRAPGGAPVPSLDALRRSLDKELHRMRERHPGRKIDFRVAVKGGRPVVKSFVAEDER